MYKKSIHLFLLLFILMPFTSSSVENPACKYEDRLLELINDYRISQSLSPLEFNKQLYSLAYDHCCYMKEKGKLSHAHFKKRFKKSGYKLCVENVGYFSNQSPSNQLKGWKDSIKHNLNLLNPGIRFAAIGKSGGYVCFLGAGD